MRKSLSKSISLLVVLAAAASAGPARAAIVVSSQSFIGPILGPNKSYASYYSSDLAVTAEWPTGSGIVGLLFFGDTHTSNADTANGANNDVLGSFMPYSTAGLNTAVDFSQSAEGFSGMMHVVDGQDLPMDGAKTPTAAFSGSGVVYGNFLRGGVYAKCTSNADCNGIYCDKDMGMIGGVGTTGNFTVCSQSLYPHVGPLTPCQPLGANQGICRDITASISHFAYEANAAKVLSSAMVNEIGPFTNTVTTFNTKRFVTNKFIVAHMRSTVSYTNFARPTTAQSGQQTAVYMWGRSSVFSNATQQAPADVYLARALVPASPGAALTFEYYSNGVWKPSQTDAAPLTATNGWGDGPTNQMTVTYLPGLSGPKKWIMMYGGGIPAQWAAAFGNGINLGSTYDVNAPQAAFSGIKIRQAPNPWGPWDPPYDVLRPDNAVITNKLCTCTVPLVCTGAVTCNPSAFLGELTSGLLYGASINETWSTSSGSTATIGWFVSTWNPYQVDQIKTTFTGLGN